ncbi:PorV/PorQ family protein [candidate division KSB1 bacterium]|nr:PorV/PorQ family protein [candidate division KSB1 bacterium]
MTRNKYRKQFYLIVIGIVLHAGFVSAQSLFPFLGGQRAGTSAATFLKIGVGAKATAMGGAFVALANDASAMYWNPAGVAQVPQNELMVTHINWPADIKYEYLGYVQHLPYIGSVGVSCSFLHTDDMAVTTEYLPHGTGEYFSYSDLMVGLTWSLNMTNRFSFGITGKYVREDIAELNMQNWMIDLGTYYWTGFKSLRFAVSLVNFGPDLKPGGHYQKKTKEGKYIQEDYEAFSPPTVFRIGSAMEFFDNETHSLTGSIQMSHPVDNAENVVIGVAYGFLKKVELRSGYKINYDEERFTFGAGMKVPLASTSLKIDYCYGEFGRLQSTHQFSIGFNF